jgi:hypothetical protein
MSAVHVLLNQSPEINEQERNLAGIAIMGFVKDADSCVERLEQYLAQEMAREMAASGMKAHQA